MVSLKHLELATYDSRGEMIESSVFSAYGSVSHRAHAREPQKDGENFRQSNRTYANLKFRRNINAYNFANAAMPIFRNVVGLHFSLLCNRQFSFAPRSLTGC
jgi:hypothetical protein